MVGEKTEGAWRSPLANAPNGPGGSCSCNKPQRTCSKIRKGWSKPPEGKLMINVDASFDSDTGSGSTGVVIRDATGECVAASCCHLPHVTDAAMAEAYALRDGLQLDQQIGVIVSLFRQIV